MRKVLGLFLSFAFVATAATMSFAQSFTSQSSSAVVAWVNFSGTGVFQTSFEIFNVSDNAQTSSITWSGVTPGTNMWKTADQYVKIVSLVTQSGVVGVQLYTDNKNGTNFMYTGASSESIGGLVNKNNPTSIPLKMAWSIKTSTSPVWAYSPDGGYNPYPGATGITVNPEATVAELGVSSAAIRYSSLWLLDKGNKWSSDPLNDPFINGAEYVSPLKQTPQASGIKFGGAPNERSNDGLTGTFFVYFGARFYGTQTPAQYGTDTLTFENYTE